MNGTMFFDSIGTQDQKVFGMTKCDNGDIQMEINNEIVGLPLNLISNRYTESPRIEQTDHKEGNMGLYRPISPNNDEDFAPYVYRNSPSPHQDVMKFTQGNSFAHLNGQTLMFEKFSHLSPEMFASPNNFHQQSTNVNMHYSFNNNYRNHNNNVNNNNYGQFVKSR